MGLQQQRMPQGQLIHADCFGGSEVVPPSETPQYGRRQSTLLMKAFPISSFFLHMLGMNVGPCPNFLHCPLPPPQSSIFGPSLLAGPLGLDNSGNIKLLQEVRRTVLRLPRRFFERADSAGALSAHVTGRLNPVHVLPSTL